MFFPVLMLAGMSPELWGSAVFMTHIRYPQVPVFIFFHPPESIGDSVTLNPSPCWRATRLSAQSREALKK